MPTLNLGYSEAIKRDLIIEYKWSTHLFTDGDTAPSLHIKPVHKNVYEVYVAYYQTEEQILKNAIDTFIKNYRITQPKELPCINLN